MDRETKTTAELEAMIMQRARELADCAEVRAVAVRSGEMGWRVVAIIRDGRMMTIKAIDEIANELRATYDLSPESVRVSAFGNDRVEFVSALHHHRRQNPGRPLIEKKAPGGQLSEIQDLHGT